MKMKNKFLKLIIGIILFSTNIYSQTTINEANHPLDYGVEINTYNANLFYERTDFQIPSAGLSLDFSWFYNSMRDTINTGYGSGWNLKCNVFYEEEDNGNVKIQRGDGRTELYSLNNQIFESTTGTFDTCYFDNGTLFVGSKYGRMCEFSDPVHKKITKETDLNGNFLEFEYNANNELIKVSDNYGREVELTWMFGLIESITDLSIPDNPRTWSYEFTGTQLTKVTNPENFICNYEYNDEGLMSKLIDENGNFADITYRKNKALETFKTVLTEYEMEYDISELNAPKTIVKELVEEEYQTTTYVYDNQKRLTLKEGNCCGFRMEYEHDTITNQISLIRDANGQERRFLYNERGDVLEDVDELGLAQTYTYTDHHQIDYMLDRKGNKTSFEYNSDGDVIATHYPLGISIFQTFNNDGTVASHTDGRGFTTQYFYDQFGYLDYVINAVGDTMDYLYDARGNKLEQSDFKGNYHKFAYNQLDWLVADTAAAPFNYLTTYEYDKVGNIVKTTLPRGNWMAMEYDAIYRTVKSLQPYGKISEYIFNQRNLIRSVDPRGFETLYTYDGRNLLIQTETQVDDTLYIRNNMTYDDEGLVLSSTDGNGNISFYKYTDRDELEQIISPQGRTSQYFYDENGLSTTTIDANGYTTRMEYDSLNRMVRSYNANDDFTEMIYDKNNNVVAVYDEMGYRDSTVYDALDRPDEMWNAVDDLIMTYAYDPNSNLIYSEDANGVVNEADFDELDRLAASRNNATAALEFQQNSTYVYDANSNVETVNLSTGNFYTSEYDSLDRLISTTDDFGKMDSTIYDLNNNVVEHLTFTGDAAHPIDTIKTIYDGVNRPIEMVDAENVSAFTTYDDNSNTVLYTDRNGQQTQMVYDSLDQQIYVVNAKMDTTWTVYDVAGAVVQLIDDNENATTYTRDSLYRITSEIFADNSTKNYQYNPSSDLIEMTDNNGVKRDFLYDQRHWLTNRNYDDGITPDDAFIYDEMGRMTNASNTNASIDMVYHPATNLMQGENLNNNLTQYNYDINNRKRTLNYPSGRQVEEQYDLRSRLENIKDLNGTFEANWQYDNENKLTFKSYNNNTESTYHYTPNNWLKDLQHTKMLAANPIAHFKHGFDKEGNKRYAEKLHHPTHSENYDYTDIYELKDFEVGTLMQDTNVTIPDPINFKNFSFDGVYNWTDVNNNGDNESYTVDEMNQYTSITKNGVTTNLDYDLNGNLLFDGNQYYQYDAENRLTKIASDAAFANIIGAYFYDPFSRRIRKETTTDTIEYFYDGWRCIEEQKSDDTSTYIYGTWIDDILNRQHNTFGEIFYHKNTLGSVIALSDENGDVIERYEYDTYGKPIIYNADFDTLTASTVDNILMFTGRRWDAESSIYYYRYRYMHPELGRFLGRDPLGYVDGMNMVQYVGGNVVNWVDPYGEFINFVLERLGKAAVDAGIEIALQGSANLLSGKGFFEDINWKEVAKAGAIGAVTPGYGNTLKNLGKAYKQCGKVRKHNKKIKETNKKLNDLKNKKKRSEQKKKRKESEKKKKKRENKRKGYLQDAKNEFLDTVGKKVLLHETVDFFINPLKERIEQLKAERKAQELFDLLNKDLLERYQDEINSCNDIEAKIESIIERLKYDDYPELEKREFIEGLQHSLQPFQD